MKSVMHYRSKELNKRSAFPAKEMGKSQKDAWNKPERVYLDRCAMRGEEGQTLSEMLLFNKTTPLDFTITNDFLESLSVTETAVLEDLAAGYSCKEIAQRQHVSYPMVQSIRKAVQEKAVEYL
jgi:ATP/maltotriose-dependent transcriptional regulator MalT